MLTKISLILECSRFFSLPMTILSWLVVFTFGVLSSGNVLYGILALFGISFAHLGTNVLDDYLDYLHLIKQVNFDKKEYLKNTQKTKCRYLISGIISETNIKILIALYFSIAGLIGLFFFIKCGKPVLYFGFTGAVIGILYSFLSRIRLSEIAIAIAYGPALFGGVYYVMTNTVSYSAMLLSLPTMFMTVVLLYIHTVMDFDYDINENHLTLANLFDSQLDSLIILKVLLILAYLSTFILCIFDLADWQIFLVFLTIPLAIDLYNSMLNYSLAPESVPEHKWFHFPMEGMKHFKRIKADVFMIRMYQSRNLMIYFAIFMVIALILQEC